MSMPAAASNANPSSGSRPRAGLVWLVGASTGIGRALALRLAGQGWTVAVSSRSQEKLALLSQTHVGIHAFPADVTDLPAMISTAAAVRDRLGAIDMAIFNQGDYEPMGLGEFDPALFRRIIDINYMGVVNGLAAVMPDMMQRRQGRILVTSSLAGYRGLPRAAPYGASKAAVINMAESLQPELAMHGVSLRVINPGFVKTPMTDKNTFNMPFLIETEAAADAIMRELDGTAFEISFPKPFALIMKILRLLPDRIFFWLSARMLK